MHRWTLGIVLACHLNQVQDPASRRWGWLSLCDQPNGHKVYIRPGFVRSKHRAVSDAKRWLSEHARKSYTVDWRELCVNSACDGGETISQIGNGSGTKP